MLKGLATVADLVDTSATHVNPALFHHGFDLGALFRRHILQMIAHVWRLLAVHFAVHMDLPQAGFNWRRGRCSLSRRGCCRESNCQSCDEATENIAIHESF